MPTPSIHDQTWKQLERRWKDLGFDGLTLQEKETISLYWLQAELFNGGLDQYFHNSSGDLVPYAISELKRIGAHQTLALLESAMGKIDANEYPVDRSKRLEILRRSDSEINPFEIETDAMEELPERFFDLAVEELASTYAGGKA